MGWHRRSWRFASQARPMDDLYILERAEQYFYLVCMRLRWGLARGQLGWWIVGERRRPICCPARIRARRRNRRFVVPGAQWRTLGRHADRRLLFQKSRTDLVCRERSTRVLRCPGHRRKRRWHGLVWYAGWWIRFAAAWQLDSAPKRKRHGQRFCAVPVRRSRWHTVDWHN